VIGRVWAVALNTFREAVRDRILYLLLVVGVVAVAFSKFLGDISVGDRLHVIVDTGLTAVSLLGVMISVFVGTGLIHKEIDKRTVYTILSKPVRRGEFILGKYLGLLGFLLLACLMISLMPLSLLFAGPLDLGLLLAMILALFLLTACFAAIGLFLSTLTLQPTIAAISTFGALLLLWIIDWAGDQAGDIDASGVLEYLSILRHFETLSRGLFSSTDILYFLLFITVFLVLSIRRLDADRLQH